MGGCYNLLYRELLFRTHRHPSVLLSALVHISAIRYTETVKSVKAKPKVKTDSVEHTIFYVTHAWFLTVKHSVLGSQKRKTSHIGEG